MRPTAKRSPCFVLNVVFAPTRTVEAIVAPGLLLPPGKLCRPIQRSLHDDGAFITMIAIAHGFEPEPRIERFGGD
jgi:hypothetical protein